MRSLIKTRIHLKKLIEIALTRQEKRLIKMQRYNTVIESDAAGWSSSSSEEVGKAQEAKKQDQLRFLQ